MARRCAYLVGARGVHTLELKEWETKPSAQFAEEKPYVTWPETCRGRCGVVAVEAPVEGAERGELCNAVSSTRQSSATRAIRPAEAASDVGVPHEHRRTR